MVLEIEDICSSPFNVKSFEYVLETGSKSMDEQVLDLRVAL